MGEASITSLVLKGSGVVNIGGRGAGVKARNLRDCRHVLPFQKCRQSQGLGVWKRPSSQLSSVLESDSVYKIPNMPTVTGMGHFGARSLGLWYFLVLERLKYSTMNSLWVLLRPSENHRNAA